MNYRDFLAQLAERYPDRAAEFRGWLEADRQDRLTGKQAKAIAAGAAPSTNYQHVVAEVAAAHPDAWAHAHREGDPRTEEFVRLFAAHVHAFDKACGLNGKRGNAGDLSDDCVAMFDPTGDVTDSKTGKPMHVIDFIIGAGGPNPAPGWASVGSGGHPGAWVQPAGAVEPKPRTCRLGVSFFPALALSVKDFPRYQSELVWFKAKLKPNYARIFWWLSDAPWRIIGTAWMSDQQRKDALRRVLEDLIGIGIQPQVTVFGSVEEDLSRRRQLIDHFADTFRPYGPKCFLVDGVNEPGAIGYETGHYAHTREIARQLAAANLGVPFLAAASPDFLHQRTASDAEIEADTCKLMDGLPAAVNAITPHWGRKPWQPHRPLGRCAAGKVILNDEARGFRSSIAQIDDPADFGRDALATARAGEIGYTLHTEPGVWEGYCDPSTNPDWGNNNKYARIQDIPRIDEIVEALHAALGEGVIIEPGNGGTGEMPLPDRGRVDAFLKWLHRYYQSPEGLQRPEGLWINGAPDFEGIAAWGYDVYLKQAQAGKTDDEAKTEVVKQIEQSDEWKKKHAA